MSSSNRTMPLHTDLYGAGVSRVEDGRTQKERMEAGELYLADDAVLQEELARAARLTKAFERLVTRRSEGTAPDPR